MECGWNCNFLLQIMENLYFRYQMMPCFAISFSTKEMYNNLFFLKSILNIRRWIPWHTDTIDIHHDLVDFQQFLVYFRWLSVTYWFRMTSGSVPVTYGHFSISGEMKIPVVFDASSKSSSVDCESHLEYLVTLGNHLQPFVMSFFFYRNFKLLIESSWNLKDGLFHSRSDVFFYYICS